jgi:hypothetical protein
MADRALVAIVAAGGLAALVIISALVLGSLGARS